ENYVGLISRDDQDSWRGLSAALYEDLVAPWRRRLPASIRRLVVVPDGALHSLPFETPAPADPASPPLVEEVAISYAPSATVLAQLQPGRPGAAGPTPADVLALAAPPVPASLVRTSGELDGESYDLGSLPYAIEEARAVVRFGGKTSEIRTGEVASEQGL